jgi:hypothetical protein
VGYLIGAIVMIIGGVIQATMGIEAAGRDLEDIAPPLSATGDDSRSRARRPTPDDWARRRALLR